MSLSMKDEGRDLIILDKLLLNEINYKGDKNVEMIDMMGDRKFVEKAISFKDVLYLKKEDYLKNLSNYIQVYKKENIQKINKLNLKRDNTHYKNKPDNIQLKYTNSRKSIIDNKLINYSNRKEKSNKGSSNKITINENSKTKLKPFRNSLSTRKSNSIDNFFEDIISSKIDFNKNEKSKFLNEEEIKKRQIYLRQKTKKVQSLIKKVPGKNLDQFKNDIIFMKEDNNIDNDLLTILKNSSFIKMMRNFSIVRDDNKMFKEYTKYFRDIYNIKPPSINVLQSIKEIRDTEVKKSLSVSNIKPNSNYQTIYSEKLNQTIKMDSKFSLTNSKFNKNKSRNNLSPVNIEIQNKSVPKVSNFNVKRNESFHTKTDVKNLVDNLDLNFRDSQTLLKQNYKIHEKNNNLLRNTFSNTFSSVNKDFGKKGLMKETSNDLIKQFSKKGDFIYGNGSGYYSSSRKIINPVFNIKITSKFI